MRIFQSRWFNRFARKEGIAAKALLDAVDRAEAGQIDAALGSEVIKQRIARPGAGKSAGYRTIILFRRGSQAFFIYGFAKSDQANVSQGEVQGFKDAARYVLSMTEKQLALLLERGEFLEMRNDE